MLIVVLKYKKSLIINCLLIIYNTPFGGAKMIRKSKRLIVLMMIISLLSGCSTIENKENPNINGNTEKDKKQIEEPKDPIQEQIKNMTLDEKIGQMVVVGIDGYTIDDKTVSMIKDNHVGGFILFGKNIKSTTQMVELLNSLKQANGVNKTPLFLSVDEEGGRITRMPKELKRIPTNKRIGLVNNKEFSYKIGSVIGEEIGTIGFNMNYSPVLDINSNPKNPVIGDRSFGSEPELVGDLGVQTMKGLQSQNVISVVKHFPGHGDTDVDSHIGLPIINYDIERLKEFELIPFKEAINSGADAVMIAHILLPKIDKDSPASLSRKIITDILREELNFDGVVITDDMTMGAIIKNYNIGDAAIKSVNAGADIVLVCHGNDRKLLVINSLKSAVEDGVMSQERIDESVYRILKLKEKYKISDTYQEYVDVAKINKNITQVLDTYLYKK
jgi:beta-N-acetylhexosaminidase